MISSDVPTAICMEKIPPTLDRITFGLYRSVRGSAIRTASTFAASAVRSRAPIFPGFSGDSATKINGFLDFMLSCAKDRSLHLATAKMPSVRPR